MTNKVSNISSILAIVACLEWTAAMNKMMDFCGYLFLPWTLVAVVLVASILLERDYSLYLKSEDKKES